MGTRNLCAAVIDGAFKIAQYGQWDGYPSGQGVVALAFAHTLKDPAVRENFERKLRQCVWITDEQLSETYEQCGAPRGATMIGMDIANRHTERFPHLSRDTGAKIFDLVADSRVGLALVDQHEFARDSLFCEYAYVLDLDANVLEAYQGFNTVQTPPAGRFAFLDDGGKDSYGGDKYYPVRLVGSWDLADLPTADEFLDQLKRQEDAEEAEPEPVSADAPASPQVPTHPRRPVAEYTPLQQMLDLAVPLNILQVRSLTPEERLEETKGFADVLAHKGDLLLYGGGHKGETAGLFNKTAKVVACMAYLPGGVTFMGSHWEAIETEDGLEIVDSFEGEDPAR
jgi:hypothetical protein